MQLIAGREIYSATDLVGFLECRHLANLERAALAGHVQRPMRADPVLDRIAQRGDEHEARFLQEVRSVGASVTQMLPVESLGRDERLIQGRDATLETMRSGVDVIYQALLFDGRRLGYADFLWRVERPSALGAWSYEVWDTKLARHAKASAVLQISMYSQMLAELQGRMPEEMHLALGGVSRETVSFRVADYAAYYRLVAREFEVQLDRDAVFPVVSLPEPVEHCGICRWTLECRAQWRAADDLSLVANLSSRQRRSLHAVDVTTRLGLAAPAQPMPERIEGVGRDALRRVRAQASIQVRGEQAGQVLSERVAPDRNRDDAFVPNRGLLMLPEPSPGDLFFDIEGDPFFGSDEVDGLDYLFGVIEPAAGAGGEPAFHAFWAIDEGTVTPAAERLAFEAFIDLVMDRLAADPNLHVYHYAPYEPTAVKRLAGRYGTREEEVDRLLRRGVFVDLYRAVRQGIRASVESYSIKRLEPLYGFEREIDLRDAGSSIVEFETWLELGQGQERDGIRKQIERYNRDDCVSTLRLRDWLEVQRTELETELGESLSRPTVAPPEETEDSEAQQAVNALVAELVAGLPVDPGEMDGNQRGRWLLGQLLNWYRREAKSTWWRYFFLRDERTDEERREEPDALGELTFERSWSDPTPRSRSTIHRFRFPPQEHKFSVGDTPRDPETDSAAGTIVAIDELAGSVDLKLVSNRPPPSATSLIPLDYINPQPKPGSLQRLARWVLEHGIDQPGACHAARDLLLGAPPRAGQGKGEPLVQDGEDPQAAARRLVRTLDESYLAIQGPPGSGKSSVAAQMIADLVAAGQQVGITSTSHKVIGELLQKTASVAAERGLTIRVGQRSDEEPGDPDAHHLRTPAAARDALADGSLDVVGGTAWLWAREDMVGSVDVLFIDEAGQMSLTDALAAAPSATNLVLLGDPQQLEQPLQGTHPPGTARSALAHVLDGPPVIPDHLGIFLDGTWRMHPAITAYTSEAFYAGRLHSHPGRDVLAVRGVPPLSGTGIRMLPVVHKGRSSESPEEVEAIARAVEALLASEPTWTATDGRERPLGPQDVLVITPYNAQVALLTEALPGVRVGTVDKFQGQEAPVAIYSMATSSADLAPRGMEFLYSLNRLNVATSRAQALAVVVASPELLRVTCRTPRQMRLVGALARLWEMTEVGLV